MRFFEDFVNLLVNVRSYSSCLGVAIEIDIESVLFNCLLDFGQHFSVGEAEEDGDGEALGGG